MKFIERNAWLAREILVHERALRGYLGRFFKNVADFEDIAARVAAILAFTIGAGSRALPAALALSQRGLERAVG